ncbi:hypothetical protein ACJX0J_034002, partial [Zea mays]
WIHSLIDFGLCLLHWTDIDIGARICLSTKQSDFAKYGDVVEGTLFIAALALALLFADQIIEASATITAMYGKFLDISLYLGANLLLDNNGILKIADFGLATFFNPKQKQHLTSRVIFEHQYEFIMVWNYIELLHAHVPEVVQGSIVDRYNISTLMTAIGICYGQLYIQHD